MEKPKLVDLSDLRDGASENIDKRCRKMLNDFANENGKLDSIAIVAITAAGDTTTAFYGDKGFTMLGAISFLAHQMASELNAGELDD